MLIGLSTPKYPHFDILNIQIRPTVQKLAPWSRKNKDQVPWPKTMLYIVLRQKVELGSWDHAHWTQHPKLPLF